MIYILLYFIYIIISFILIISGLYKKDKFLVYCACLNGLISIFGFLYANGIFNKPNINYKSN